MNIVAKKSLGQNFLSNPKILEKIANAAHITKADTVLEVGPGTGNLTAILAEKAGHIIAVEKDRRLIEQLRIKFPDAQRIEIIEKDILIFNPSDHDLKAGEYKVVANIPYYITSHLIRTIFEKWPHPSIIVLTVQKEVAQRIVAQAPNMNLLALSVQFFADAKIIDSIKRGSFNPIPKVDSAIIQLIPKVQTPENQKEFFEIIKKAFSSPRKQLANNLDENKEKIQEILSVLHHKPTARPGDLSLHEWLKLTEMSQSLK